MAPPKRVSRKKKSDRQPQDAADPSSHEEEERDAESNGAIMTSADSAGAITAQHSTETHPHTSAAAASYVT